jgi:signal transduction histidine kinase
MRLRIAITLAALSMLAIVAMALSLLTAMDESQEEFIDAELSTQVAYSMRVWRESPAAAFPNTPDMRLYRIAGNGVPEGELAEVPAHFATLPIGNHEIFVAGQEYHVAVREDDSGRYILAYDVESSEARERGLLASIVTTALALGLLILVAGYLLAGRLTRQLEQLAAAVSAEGGSPLADAALDRELLPVASALDAYRQRQQAMLARERAFAANLSHEIRTPLTGIRTDAELLTTLPALPEAASRRAARIIASVDRIEALAASLLLLAREAQPVTQQVVPLAATIESVWEALLAATPKPLTLRLEIPAGTSLDADPALLALVLRNLLDNALRYSEAGEIVGRLAGTRLAISDTGPGFAGAELDQVFDRFFVGTQGRHGLGLALVRHVCAACGWTATAGNDAAGHGVVSIDFAASLRRA